MIRLRCVCGNDITVDESEAGKSGPCMECGKIWRIPLAVENVPPERHQLRDLDHYFRLLIPITGVATCVAMLLLLVLAIVLLIREAVSAKPTTAVPPVSRPVAPKPMKLEWVTVIPHTIAIDQKLNKLFVILSTKNVSPRKLDYAKWSSFVAVGMKMATLNDEHGSEYAQLCLPSECAQYRKAVETRNAIGMGVMESLYQGKVFDDVLVFEAPADNATSIQLIVDKRVFGDTGKLEMKFTTASILRIDAMKDDRFTHLVEAARCD